MSIFTSAIERGVRSGFESAVKNAVPGIVDTCLDALWDHPWFPFIVGAQARLIESGMKPRAAWVLARKVLTDHVKSEKQTFGDPAFDWGPRGGREIIEECEIAYWDDK